MVFDTELTPFSIEQRMLHHLMIKSNSMEDIGLLHGKMGIAILFLCYGKYRSNPVYTDMGEDLLNDIWEMINDTTSLSFESGLCGIGWGIEYLIQYQLAEGSANDICEDIDKKIISIHPGRLDDLSLETGLNGILHYISIRVSNNLFTKSILPFDEEYLGWWSQVLSPNIYKSIFSYSSSINFFIEEVQIGEKEILSAFLGIRKGIAGLLFKRLPCNFV